jgi:hypothetical protein
MRKVPEATVSQRRSSLSEAMLDWARTEQTLILGSLFRYAPNQLDHQGAESA